MRSWLPLAIVCASVAVAQEPVRPLAIDDALGTVEFGQYVPVELSPDGRLVTYTTVDPRARGEPSREESWRDATGIPRIVSGGVVWVTEVTTGQAWRVSPDGSSSYGGVWSPDGRRLAFISDSGGASRVWIWTVRGRARAITAAITRTFAPFERPVWMPDGRHLLVKVRAADQIEAPPAAPPLVVVLTSSARDSAGRAPRDTGVSAIVQRWLTADLALVDAVSGKLRVVERRAAIAGIWPSPAGRSVAYARRRADDGAPGGVFDVVVWSWGDDERRVVARAVPHPWGHNVSWSPDGRHLAFYASGSHYSPDEADAATRAPGCYVVPAEGGPEREVCGERWRDVARGIDPPQWTADGMALLVPAGDTLWRIEVGDGRVTRLTLLPGAITGSRAGRGSSALVAFRDDRTMHEGLARVDQRSGAVTILTAGPQSLVWGSGGGRTLAAADFTDTAAVFTSQSIDRPEELWYARHGGEPRQLTRVNAHLEGYRFGSVRLIEWLTDDGKPASGALFLPVSRRPEQRYPLIVRAYPDARGALFAHAFGGYRPMNHVQLYTTRGYAVLYADVPRSGVAPMLEIAKAVLPGVNRAIELGVADPERLAVMGHSYAGYAALSLIVLTNRFRAAIVESSTGNLVAGAHQLRGVASMNQWAEEGQGMMRGSLWEMRERYIESSPFFYLDRATTPVLLLHGELDDVSSHHSDDLFVALRRLGKEVEYAKYPGEGHAYWSLAAERDAVTRTLAWLDRFLGARPTPSVTSANP